MKNIFLVVGLLISVAALARPDYPNVPGTIYGGWKAYQDNRGGFGVDLRVYFAQNNTMLAANTCTYQGQSLTVEVKSPVVITKDTLTISAPASVEKTVGGLKCQASIAPGAMNYVVNGDSMTMTMNGQSVTVPRSQE